MNKVRVFITGIGIISPVGTGVIETKKAVKSGKIGIKPIYLFPTPHNNPLPVGEISIPNTDDVPRTHALALIAAREAVDNFDKAPDAITIGSATGGMPLTENLIKEKNFQKHNYKYHSTGSVAEYIAGKINCKGTVLTVSTACSSGALAIKIAIEQLRCGTAKSVLTGGADALCKLTYHGFNSLQLIDPTGSHPFDSNRKGMSVAEGAAMLLLVADEKPPDNSIAEILGAGISCDAHHPAAPHPEGVGAVNAMNAALEDAEIFSTDINYINMHGTGTIDNDLSEAMAIHKVFGDKIPHLSSTKGAFGHSLAAAGAVESVISAISITENVIPENSGCHIPDPELNLNPVRTSLKTEINTVLSNSFGFGGNNASIVISSHENIASGKSPGNAAAFSVLGSACFTGAGALSKTIDRLHEGNVCSGIAGIDIISENLPKKKIRRLKRLPRMTLSLAVQAHENSGEINSPSSIYFGTGWGSLSETYDFLNRLFESDEQFPSPTDFIGSVHNAPAGQAAIWFGSTGANITTTGGDYSFEQALISASLLARENNDLLMLIGADEYHEVLSKTLDASAALDTCPSDGGGAIMLKKSVDDSGLRIFPSFFEYSQNNEFIIRSLIKSLGSIERINDSFGAIFIGIPAAQRELANKQFAELQSIISYVNPVIDYRKFTGEFASASAVGAVIASQYVERGEMPASLCGEKDYHLHGKGILLLGLGDFVTAIEVLP